MRHLPKRSRTRLPTDAEGKDAGADSGSDYSWRLKIGGHETLHDRIFIPLILSVGISRTALVNLLADAAWPTGEVTFVCAAI